MTTHQRFQRFLPLALNRRAIYESVVSLMLLALIVLGLPAISDAQQTCLPDGDVDQNGSVTAADALLAFQQALSLVQLDACQLTIADVFPQPAAPDGNITAADALCIFQKALSLPSCLPDAPANEPPVAHVDQNLFVDEGDTVYLSGLADDPDGDIVSYLWEQTGGTDVVLSDAETATASFTAPEVLADETLTFQLTVSDDGGSRVTSSQLTVTVRQVESAVLKVSVFGEGDLAVVGANGQLDCDAITMCEGIFNRGSDLVIEASPAADWIHDGWDGCDQINGNRCTVSLRGDRLVSVTFVSGEPLQLEDNVIVLDDEQLDRIVSYDADTGLLVVEPGMPGVNDWAVGDILLSDGIDSDPGRHLAFALRITLIEDQLGEIHIETYPASLAELFRSGSLRGAGQILDVGVPAIAAPGTAIVLEQSDSAVVSINYQLNDDVSVSGNLHFHFSKPEINFNRDPLEARVLLKASAKPSLSVSIGSYGTGPIQRSSGISLERSFRLMKLERTVIWVAPTIPIPVVAKFSLPVYLTIKVFTNVLGIEPTATYDVSITAGVHYKADRAAGERLQSIFDVQGQPTFSMGQLATGFLTGERSLDDLELGLEAGIRAEGEALFYATAGPVINFRPYLGAKTCEWTYVNIYRGADLEIGGKIKLPSFRWWKGGDKFSVGLEVPVLTLGPSNIGTVRIRPRDAPAVLPVREMEIARVGIDSLQLSWFEPENRCGISGYNVYRDGRKIAGVVSQGESMGEPEPIHYFDTGLKPDTEYCYQAAAVLPTGEEAMPSHQVCATTLEPIPPGDLLLEDPTSNSMLLTWVPPYNSYAVSDYVVYRHDIISDRDDDYDGASPYDITVIGSVGAPGEEFRITGLQPATEYCFSAASVYEGNHRSDPSEIVCGETAQSGKETLRSGCTVIPQQMPPGVPIGLLGVSVVHWRVHGEISGPVGSEFFVASTLGSDLVCGSWTRVQSGDCVRGPSDPETTQITYEGRSVIPQTGQLFTITSWVFFTDGPNPRFTAELLASSSSPLHSHCRWLFEPDPTVPATDSKVTDNFNVHINAR